MAKQAAEAEAAQQQQQQQQQQGAPAPRSRRAALLAAARRGDVWAEAGAAGASASASASAADGAPLRVATWSLPRDPTAAVAALDAGVTLLAAALSGAGGKASPSQRVLLAPSPGAEAAAGALAAAWLALAQLPPEHGALGALRAVAVHAPGCALDGAARNALAAWAQRTLARTL